MALRRLNRNSLSFASRSNYTSGTIGTRDEYSNSGSGGSIYGTEAGSAADDIQFDQGFPGRHDTRRPHKGQERRRDIGHGHGEDDADGPRTRNDRSGGVVQVRKEPRFSVVLPSE